ncbi:MAG: hypothetical protein NTU43_12590 [Bacteroidetes bacterium]|nr:hypothetical protein [Bacteroidota bacterium]
MNKSKSPIIELISWAAILGNILLALWILYNGINEGFQGTAIEKFSYVILITLLSVNAFLLLHKKQRPISN